MGAAGPWGPGRPRNKCGFERGAGGGRPRVAPEGGPRGRGRREGSSPADAIEPSPLRRRGTGPAGGPCGRGVRAYPPAPATARGEGVGAGLRPPSPLPYSDKGEGGMPGPSPEGGGSGRPQRSVSGERTDRSVGRQAVLPGEARFNAARPEAGQCMRRGQRSGGRRAASPGHGAGPETHAREGTPEPAHHPRPTMALTCAGNPQLLTRRQSEGRKQQSSPRTSTSPTAASGGPSRPHASSGTPESRCSRGHATQPSRQPHPST